MVTDFIYDGKRLSDFGCTIVLFEDEKKGEIETDSKYSFNHISLMRGKRQPFITSVYEDPLKMEIYIAKDACVIEGDLKTSDLIISPTEMTRIKRWLVRPTAHKLSVIGGGCDNVYWMGSFELEEYIFGDGRIGAHLTFECDAPFGYYQDVTFTSDLEGDGEYDFNCTSDEIGWLYPNTFEITVKQNGNLEITNTSDNRIVKINNCVNGEVIRFDKNLQISTSATDHKIMNDFNFTYYRINNSLDNVGNSIKTNLPISFSMTYSPIAKVVIV